jgi:hypothetical protein
VRFHRLRLSCDLAQRQRSGKNLYENRVHAITHQTTRPQRETASAGPYRSPDLLAV